MFNLFTLVLINFINYAKFSLLLKLELITSMFAIQKIIFTVVSALLIGSFMVGTTFGVKFQLVLKNSFALGFV